MAFLLSGETPVVKRAGALWPQMATFENLHRAYLRARRGKRFNPEVLAFEAERERNLLDLLRELDDGSYAPGAYRTFTITDPKPRLISAAPFRDRVVHHALVAAIEPVFERTFIFDNYANRKGKGTHAALRRFCEWCRAYPYVLRCDIRKFFPSVDHKVLKGLLRRKIKDARVLGLCDCIVDASNPQEPVTAYFPGDDLFTPLDRRRGLPIGNLTSQVFQNVYLNPLDHFVKEDLRCRAYLRYVDDFALFAEDKRTANRWRVAIRGFLPSLRLEPNPAKFELRRTRDGVNWLGFLVFPDDCRVRRERRVSFRRRLRAAWDRARSGEWPCGRVTEMVQAWVAHAAHGRTAGLRRSLLSRHPPWLEGGVPRREACVAGRFLEQQSNELPRGVSQTQSNRQPEHE